MEQLNNLSLPNMPEMSEVLTSLMYGGEKQKSKSAKAAKKRQWGIDKWWRIASLGKTSPLLMMIILPNWRGERLLNCQIFFFLHLKLVKFKFTNLKYRYVGLEECVKLSLDWGLHCIYKLKYFGDTRTRQDNLSDTKVCAAVSRCLSDSRNVY